MAMSQICKLISVLILGTCIVAALGSQGRYHCHCSGGCNGNVEDYDCRGSCKEGFYGQYCQKENVALNKTANQSTVCEHPWGGAANLAVDGNTITRFGEDNETHPCTCAKGNRSTYWSVDLGQEYTLHDMMVYQRDNHHDRLRGLYITVDNRECWRWTDDVGPPTQFNVTCNQTGREVTFQVNRTEYFTLCEVLIFVCTDFWYGADCDKTCHCRDQTEVCNKRTGNCTDCPDGWTGDACDAECKDRWYGADCNKTCNCRNQNEVCNKTTGKCTDCPDEWTGDACDECKDLKYGIHCNKSCNCRNQTEVCDKRTGNCTDCPDGWTGVACDACSDGYWGTSCKKCGHCETRDICDKTTGHCAECEIGWELPNCTACSDGYWGTSCKKCGHCETGDICDKTTGHCTHCEIGWALQNCTDCAPGNYGTSCSEICGHCRGGNQRCDTKTGVCTDGCTARWMDSRCKTDIIIIVVAVGASVAAVFLVVSTVLCVIFNRRKKRTSQSKQDVFTHNQSLASRNEVPLVDLDDLEADTDDEVDNLLSQPNTSVDDNVYANFVNTNIPVETLGAHIKDKDFKQEYLMLPAGLLSSHEQGKNPLNKKRNRYLTTFPYDHSRVQLKVTKMGQSDYINANYIDGFKKPKAYIATQGPVPFTVNDFWRMIYQAGASKIVMLANLVEDGKNKCAKYWPEVNSVMAAGGLTVTAVSVQERADYTIREFYLGSDMGQTTVKVTLFHFTTWPDHGVPSAPALLGFWKRVKKEPESRDGPVVVHCSAGIGRTGTFIGLDYLMDEARDIKVVNVFQCVRQMRDNRINMVQTLGQYQFLHEVLLEATCSRDTFYTVDSFKESLFNDDAEPAVHRRRLLQEFDDLTRLKKPVSKKDIDRAMLPENTEKNRSLSIIPVSFHRVLLTTPVAGTNDYINAVVFPSCTNRRGFLVTQLPLELTVIDFWRMVYEQGCHTIVCLSGDVTQNHSKYWPSIGEMATIGPFIVENQSTLNTSREISEVSLTLKSDDVYENTTKKSMKLFVLNDWSDKSSLPSDKYELLLFLDKLERRLEEFGKSPVIIQCIDGAQHSGLFCVLSNVIAKLKLDNDVDIFVTVRELQCIRPQIVGTVEQYQYCYDVVKEYIRNLDIYHNI